MLGFSQGLFLASVLFAASAMADIASPARLNCKVTKVTPTGARFFGFGKGPVVGDSTELDLGAKEIAGIDFASGAHIGSTVRPHPLIKTDGVWEGTSAFQASFQSQANRNLYEAILLAHDGQQGKVPVSLDVLEKRNLGRMTLHQLDLECTRP